MGLLRRMKDMRDMTEAAPGQLAQYQAQAAAAQGCPAGSADFAPVAGVSLEQFATVFKGAAALSHDDSRLTEIAQVRGIDPDRWETAAAAWNARIQSSPAVANRFSQLYREA
jgi:hypothetical protein